MNREARKADLNRRCDRLEAIINAEAARNNAAVADGRGHEIRLDKLTRAAVAYAKTEYAFFLI